MPQIPTKSRDTINFSHVPVYSKPKGVHLQKPLVMAKKDSRIIRGNVCSNFVKMLGNVKIPSFSLHDFLNEVI